MAKPPIEWRATKLTDNPREIQDALEAYKAAERAKVLARVRKHRAKKAQKP